MKDAFYFSHDMNARTDPKIMQMRSVYKSEGYGWYWILVEMMREQEDYSLSLDGKYVFNAFALQLDTTAERCKEFVEDCINEFKLFESTDTKFYSKSLKGRMKLREEKSEKARESANARWNKPPKQAKQEESQNDSNANALKSDAIKESKEKESKDNIYTDIFNFYIKLDIVKHKTLTPVMKKAIDLAMKQNSYSVEDCNALLQKHKKVIEKTKGGQYPVKKRPLVEFFGQKIKDSTALICTQYEEGGKYDFMIENVKANKPGYKPPTRRDM